MLLEDLICIWEKQPKYYNLGNNNSRLITDRRIRETVLYRIPEENLMSEVSNLLESGYEEKDFQNATEMAAVKNFQSQLLTRFLTWYNEEHGTDDILARNIKCAFPFPVNGQEICFKISLILKRDGVIEAVLLSDKNKYGISEGARKPERLLTNDIGSILAYSWLKVHYPDENVRVTRVFLRNGNDKGGEVTPWKGLVYKNGKRMKQSADVNELRFIPPACFFLDNGDWNECAASDHLADAIHIWQGRIKNCQSCRYNDLCQQVGFTPSYFAPSKRTKTDGIVTIPLPNYNAEQMAAISCCDGPQALVCGPGSGKTATLCGKIVSLIRGKGVSAGHILAITFTKKAARELLERVSGYLGISPDDPTRVPVCKTINALTYNILRSNSKVLGYVPKLLTDAQLAAMASKVLERCPMIGGLSYASFGGEHGLVATFMSYFEEFRHKGEDGLAALCADRAKNGRIINLEDLTFVCQSLNAAIRENGYITYDEQISLCVQMLDAHPDILSHYRKAYKYIFVDEYQDTNDDTDTLIYLLAGRDGNVCIVGDDDQAIYRFRGGDNEYMLGFPKKYPNCKVLPLGTNYRSTRQIVDFAAALMEGVEGRYNKPLHALRDGVEPEVGICTTKDLNDTIEMLHNNGYSYGDICIIGRKNAILADLQKELTCPTQRNRALLEDDPFFNLLISLLRLHRDNENGLALYTLISLFNKTAAEECLFSSNTNIYKYLIWKYRLHPFSDTAWYKETAYEGDAPLIFQCFSLISEVFEKLDNAECMSNVVSDLSLALHAEECASVLEIMDMIMQDPSLESEALLARNLEAVLMFPGSSQRLDVLKTDSVVLCTAHDSKGLEWPVVIVWDTARFGIRSTEYPDVEEYNEERRLLYVAMTRPRDRLYLLENAGTDSGKLLCFCDRLRQIAAERSNNA